ARMRTAITPASLAGDLSPLRSDNHQPIEERLQVGQALQRPEQVQDRTSLLFRQYFSSQAVEFCLHVRIRERIVPVAFGIGCLSRQALAGDRGYLHTTVVFLWEALRESWIFTHGHFGYEGAQCWVVHALLGEAGGRDRAIVEGYGHQV